MKLLSKKAFLLITLPVTILLLSYKLTGSIYEIAVKDSNGVIIDLNSYRGKKMMFIIVSGNEPDSLLKQYAVFYKTYKDNAVMIGIPSLEEGYLETNKAVMKKRFDDNKISFVFTEPMHTRKALGQQQSALMQWLTNKKMNNHFGNDATAAGFKFFVDEAGELYAVINPQAPLTHPIFERIMSKPEKKSNSPSSAN